MPEPDAPPRPLTLVAVGDCLLTRRVSALQDPDFLALVELLHGAQCVFGNCEMVFAEPGAIYREFKEIDPHVLCAPWGTDELRFMGINFMGTANNHTMDFGDAGLVSTLANLDRAGIVHAGAGLDLEQAAQPAFLDTAAGGVALISCAASFLDHYAAGPAHPILKGRPGLNPLRVQHTVQVERTLFKELQQVQARIQNVLGWNELPDILQQVEKLRPVDTSLFLETPIMAGEEVDVVARLRSADVARFLDSIRTARARARLVIASIHAHEMRWRAEIPDPYLPPFAHACLEAGADVCLVTGPHVLRGMEIHQGKPIFYSLGNFFAHFNFRRSNSPAKAPPLPQPLSKTEKAGLHHQRRFWESFAPRITFAEGGEIAEIELHPVTLGFDEPLSERGTPRLARGEEACGILTRLAELSAPYGTDIDIEGELGRVRLGRVAGSPRSG